MPPNKPSAQSAVNRFKLTRPGGLCPRCLIGLNLDTETVLTGEEAGQGDVACTAAAYPGGDCSAFSQLDVLECLGRGGMGVVYKARQRSLGRLVALKLLAPEREKDPEFAARFAREAKALAQLSHPHIVTIYDFGEANGFFYLLMEFVDGVNLRELLRLKRLSPEEALAIVPSLCDALQFAHDRGIVHRDIKPENLLLAKDGGVKIADFGIAKMMGPGMDQPKETGTAGTPGYMAPEQVTSPEKVDSRADIYSLGVCFYEMLTGEKAVRADSAAIRKVQVDVRIDDIVLRALERTPEMRYQTAAEFRTAVETVASAVFPARAEDQRAGAREIPPDRSWMRTVGLLLLIPGIPLTLFGMAMIWLFSSSKNGQPSVIAALLTMGSIAAAALLLGGSVVLLRLSAGRKALPSHSQSAEPPPLKPWQQSWLAEPLRRRRTVFWMLLLLTFGLFTVFAWPSYHVTGAPGAQTAVTGFGFPEPWLKRIRIYGTGGMQNWPEYGRMSISFAAGLIGTMCWILLASLQATEARALPTGRRNSWGNILLAGPDLPGSIGAC
jgi:serine/threonine protein kinase